MISPKHIFNNSNSSVTNKNIFVDRECARQIFMDFINKPTNNNILVYFGVGGIGKSRLLAENISYFESKIDNFVRFSIDFNDVNKRSKGETLVDFVDNCSNKKISFLAFNLAYAIYFHKKNSTEEYGRNKHTTITEKYSDFMTLIGFFDHGYSKFAIDLLSKLTTYIKKQSLNKEVLDDLKILSTLSLTEIEDRLPSYFQYDLYRYFKKHPNTKFLFTFDTFEVLSVQQSDRIHRRRNEEWIQDIIAHFHNSGIPTCYFMICGREKLHWGADWEEHLIQHELLDLPINWANYYLESMGILDSSIRSAIITNSNGHPLYLYLSAKTYVDMIDKGLTPEPSTFRGEQKQIIQRFIYNLNDELIRILKYLSIPNFFTDTIFVYILSHFNIACDPERFEQIISHSFIQNSLNNQYYINSLMRDGLIKETGANSYYQVNKLMLQYYEKLFRTNREKCSFLQMIFHASCIMHVKDFENWFYFNNYNVILKEFQLRGEQSIVYSVTENLICKYGTQHLNREIINIYIDMLHLGGDYHAAVTTCSDYLSTHNWDEIIHDEELCRMWIRKIHHLMFYTPVDQLITEIENIINHDYIQTYPDLYNELLFLIGGNLGILSGRFQYAESWLTQALKYAKENGSTNFILRNERKLADLETYRDNPDAAIKKIKQYMTLTSSINHRYEIYMLASLGEAYRKFGDYVSAYQCFTSVKEKCLENRIPSWIAHAILAQSILLLHNKQYKDAIIFVKDALKRYQDLHHSWGEINAKTILILLKSELGQSNCHQEAIELKKYAEYMNYRYNVKILDEFISNEKIDYLQLFFL